MKMDFHGGCLDFNDVLRVTVGTFSHLAFGNVANNRGGLHEQR